jgi:hypothetical protein
LFFQHFLVCWAVTHLQYADDTVIFLETNEDSIANTKFLLYCFENVWPKDKLP